VLTVRYVAIPGVCLHLLGHPIPAENLLRTNPHERAALQAAFTVSRYEEPFTGQPELSSLESFTCSEEAATCGGKQYYCLALNIRCDTSSSTWVLCKELEFYQPAFCFYACDSLTSDNRVCA
jgi:hypothetical protein